MTLRLFEAPAYIGVYAESQEEADRLIDEFVWSCDDPRLTLTREECHPQEVRDLEEIPS